MLGVIGCAIGVCVLAVALGVLNLWLGEGQWWLVAVPLLLLVATATMVSGDDQRSGSDTE